FHYILTARNRKGRDLAELRTLQDWVIKPALRKVPGTAEINGWGGYEKQFQVRIDPFKLVKYDLAFDQVVQAGRDNNAGGGGGYLPKAGDMYLVRGMGRVQDVEQIRNIVVTTPREGVPVFVGDVAQVEVGHDLRLGGVTAQGRGEAVLG